MNKIGILTFFDEDNFGAVLQSYALQKTLESLGADPRFLRIDPPKLFSRPSGPSAVRRIKEQASRRHALFEDFRKKHFKTEQFSETGLESYEAFITGSDQVFNPKLSCWRPEYLLGFAPPGKRFSYAASFGGERIPENLRSLFSAELGKFTEISLREDLNSATSTSLKVKYRTDIDPVLFLSSDKWCSIASVPLGKRDLMLFYLVRDDPELVESALGKAEREGLEPVFVCGSLMPKYGVESWFGVSPDNWLGLIASSAAVATNSYHGLLFSLMFGKEFCFSPLAGDLANRNSRISAVEELVGRKIFSGWNQPPDAEKFRETALPYIKRSRDYLARIVESGEKT